MYNCALIKLKEVANKYGNLIPIEEYLDIPFRIKRVYYIFSVDTGVKRGHHAHKTLHQLLICINGTVKIKVSNSVQEEIIELNNPSVGLYIGTLIWHEMFEFSEDAILLVLASDYYNEDDYIRNYDFYLEEAVKRFRR